MSFEEMVVALVGATGAFILVGYLSSKIFGLIQSWINRKNGSITEKEFNRLGKAFMNYKKNTEQRLRNLEAIISTDEEQEDSEVRGNTTQIEAPRETIEIEDRETGQKKSSGSDESDNLRNMLRE